MRNSVKVWRKFVILICLLMEECLFFNGLSFDVCYCWVYLWVELYFDKYIRWVIVKIKIKNNEWYYKLKC